MIVYISIYHITISTAGFLWMILFQGFKVHVYPFVGCMNQPLLCLFDLFRDSTDSTNNVDTFFYPLCGSNICGIIIYLHLSFNKQIQPRNVG